MADTLESLGFEPAIEAEVRIPREVPTQPGIPTIAYRNNNPGNIRVPGSTEFRQYGSPEEGFNDIIKNVKSRAAQGHTLGSYIGVYAPKKDNNNTEAYIQNASKELGVDPTTPLKDIDPVKLAAFQAKEESGSHVEPKETLESLGFEPEKGGGDTLESLGFEPSEPTIPGYGAAPGVPQPKVPGLNAPAAPSKSPTALPPQPTGVNPELTTGTGFTPADFAEQQKAIDAAHDAFMQRWALPKFGLKQTNPNAPATEAERVSALGAEGAGGLTPEQLDSFAKGVAQAHTDQQNLLVKIGDTAVGLASPENIGVVLGAEFGAGALKAAVNAPKVVRLLEEMPGGANIKKALDFGSRAAVPAVFGTQAASQSVEAAKAGKPEDAIINALFAAASFMGVHEAGKGVAEGYPTAKEKATTPGGEAAATAKAYAAAGENLKASEWAKAVKVPVQYEGAEANVNFTGSKKGVPQFDLVDKEGEVRASGSYDDIQEALKGKQEPQTPPAEIEAGKENPPEAPEAQAPQAPSPAEPQQPPAAEPAVARAPEAEPPQSPAPPAGKQPITTGVTYEKPSGKYTILGYDGDKVIYEFENKAGSKQTFSKPVSVFEKIVAGGAVTAPQTAPTPSVEKPAEAVAAPVAEPVSETSPAPAETPKAPVENPEPGQEPATANKPAITAEPAEIKPAEPREVAENRPQPIETPQENRPEPISAVAEKPVEGEKPTYHSTQVNLHPDVAEKVVEFGKQIPESKLAEDGRETEPHITLQYGIDKGTKFEEVAKSLEGQGPITAKLGTMSVFKTPEYDVLKVDVKSPDLEAAKNKVKAGTNAIDTHPTYQPHVTIAYLKPGEGDKYVGKPLPNVTGKTLTFNSVAFSPKGGEQQEIPLTGQPLAKPEQKTKIKAGAKNGPVPANDRGPLEEQLPAPGGTAGEVRPPRAGSPSGSETSGVGPRTGAGEGSELEPSGGTVHGVVGDPANPERTFPPRSPDVNSGNHERDYRIPDGRRMSGTPESRARANLDAIKVLRQVESEHRLATVDEQHILAQYMGWGAVPQLFAGNKPEFVALQNELRNLVSEQEYSDAERSTTNAHYTGDNVVDGMWKAMQALGAKPGMSWLEPAVGTGNFFGRQPAELLQGARRIGLDKDSLTGGIAKLLYPDSGIDITAYEDAELPKDYFDGAISNVPFGDFGVHDAEFRGKPYLTNPIHNYFFAKTLGMVRPGGIIGFVTSRYTMDGYQAGHTNLRKWINDKADFLGAVRLPSGAFRENAGTDVITDIIFLRRRLPGAESASEPWIETDTKQLTSDRGRYTHEVNEYYTKHAEMILGKEGLQRGQFSDHDYDVKGTVTQEQLDKALASIGQVGKFQDFIPQRKSKTVAIRELNTPEQAKLGGMFFDAKGDLFRKTSKGSAEPMEVSAGAKQRIKGLLEIRDARVALTDAELADKPKPELDFKRQKLNKLYDAYVAKHGPLSSQSNTGLMKGDPDAPLLVSLEKKFDKGNKKEGIQPKAEKHPIFSRRMLAPADIPTSVSDPKDAMYITLNTKGRLDFDNMAQLTGRTPDQLKNDLAGLIFENPTTKTWETADEYLSGSVRTKLKQARAIAKVEPHYEANVKALEAAQPEDIPPGKIRALLGVTWVPLDTYTEFVKDLLAPDRPVEMHYAGGEWSIKTSKQTRFGNGPQWGTARVAAADILKDTLNLRRVKVTDRDSHGNTHTNVSETQAARAKQMEMQEHFEKWLFADVKRGDEMVRIYNDTQNDLRLRVFDGQHLTLPGMSRDAAVVRSGDLDPHQKAAVWRQIVQPNVMLAHAVGTGKTFEMIAGGMELQRLGLIKRPMYVVPNSTLTGWQNQFGALYPQKRVLVFTEKDLAKDKRQLKMAQIATGDWDAVVVPHSSFQFIPTGDEIFNEHFEKLSAQLQESIDEASAAGVDTRQIKRMQKAKERLLTSLKDRRAEESKDQTVTWEQLGIDQLFVDESHEYKKLGFATKQGNVAGIDQNGNQKTFDLQMKVRYTQKYGRGVTFATGTPVTNTMGELYSIMKYLIEPELEARGLGRFDEWAAAFGRTKDVFERKVEGGGYQVKARFAQFVNLPELAQLFRSFADVVTSDMVDIPRPKLIGGEREAVLSELTPEQEYILENDLQPRAKSIRADPRGSLPDNMLAVYSDADKMALDIRLLNPQATDIPTSRANQVANKVKRWYDESKDIKGTQLIFSDIGVPHEGKTLPFELYKDLANKLVERGIPRNEIAFVHDAKTKPQRDKLFQKVNDGEIRVLIGSTPRMGVGVNVQDRLYGLHHVSIPHRPSDLEQREGRILRQGNQNPEVHIAYYMTKGSLDEVKYGAVVRKGKFVNDLMKGNTDVREAEDLDGMIMSLENFQAMTSGDPRVMRKMEVDAEVDRLESVHAGWKNQQWRLRHDLSIVPLRIKSASEDAEKVSSDIKKRDAADGKWEVNGKAFDSNNKEQFKALDEAMKKQAEKIRKLPIDSANNTHDSVEVDLGTSNGMKITALHHENKFDKDMGYVRFYVGGSVIDIMDRDLDVAGIQVARRIQNRIDDLEKQRAYFEELVTKAEKDKKDIEAGIQDKWPYAEKLQKLLKEQTELFKALGGDKDDDSAVAVGEGGEVKDASVEAEEQAPSEEEQDDEEETAEVSPEFKARMAERKAGGKVQNSDTGSMADYRPQGAGKIKEDDLRGWYYGTVDGENFYSNGHFLIQGETPPQKEGRDGRDMSIGFEKTLTPTGDVTPVQPAAFSPNPNTEKKSDVKKVVWFDDGTPIDAKYYNLFRNKFPNAEYSAGKRTDDSTAIYVKNDGKPVGVIMPLKMEPPPEVKDIIETPQRAKTGERGAAPMLTDIPQWVAEQFKEEGPKLNYSWMGAKKRVLLPGRQLKEVQEASREEVFPAAVRAGSSESQASVMMQQGAPAIRKALEGSDISFEEMRLALLESNVRGKAERWRDFANQVTQWDDEETKKSLQANPDGSPSFYLDLLSNIEGRQGLAQDLGQTAAALAETEDWSTLRELLSTTFNDAASRVAEVMDPAWFDYVADKLQNDPKGKEALKLYEDLIAKPMADNHAINEGVFANASGPLGSYYPMIPLALDSKRIGPPGRRLAYHKPRNPSNYFATGLSDAYDPSTEALSQKISQNLRANDKAALIQTLKDSGWLVPESKAFKTDDGQLAMDGPDGEEYLAVRKETSAARAIVKDGKVIRVGAQFNVMPKFMDTGLSLILERGPMDPNDIAKAMRWANTLATKGPLELIYHSTGVLGSMYANTPFLGESGLDKALSLPIIKWFGIRAKLFSVDPQSPENVKKLQEIAKAGALPAKSGKETYSKQFASDTGATLRRFSFSPLLYGPRGVDVRARILMYDIWKAAFPNGTTADLHDFVNQIGNYTPEFQGAIERFLKHSGFGTFATAGMTRIINSGQNYTGGPTWDQGNWKIRAAWLMTASAWMALAIWMVANKALTGKNPDKRSKFNDIPVGGGSGYIDQYRHSPLGNALWGKGNNVGHINLSYFNDPLSLRGARAMGLSGAYEAHQLGGKPWQMAEAANKDVLNAMSGPALGPAAKALFVLGTGAEPSITGLRDPITGRSSLQLYPAVPKGVKPGLPSYGARAFAATRELNSFYIDSGEHLGELTGLFAKNKQDRGDWFTQTAFQLAFPGLFAPATNPFAKSNMLQKQARSASR